MLRSCWVVKPPPSSSSLEDSNRFSSKTSLYSAPTFILPILINFLSIPVGKYLHQQHASLRLSLCFHIWNCDIWHSRVNQTCTHIHHFSLFHTWAPTDWYTYDIFRITGEICLHHTWFKKLFLIEVWFGVALKWQPAPHSYISINVSNPNPMY